MPPLVTIIIPAYRQPAFLNQALRSLAAQTYTPLEILIVDDASGEKFTRQYELPSNAQLIVHPINRATAAISRNEALAIARGSYITFLDQDDLYEPEKIARQVAALQAAPSALLTFCHYLRIQENLQPRAKQDAPRTLERDPVAQFLRRNIIHCPAQVMMRRTAFDQIGPFDEAIRGAADYDMWLRAAMVGERKRGSGEGALLADSSPLVRYRHHGQQWSRQGVLVCRGTVRVLEKALDWTRQARPDLTPLARRRLGRWLRELARAQLLSNNERQLALATLRRSLQLRPLDLHAYTCLWRAWRASRPGTTP